MDTLFMAGYFLVRIGHLLEREDYLEDGILQYHGHERFLQSSATNLYYHGWDHLSQSNMSSVFWGRGNTWAAITMARALRIIHVTHPSFMVIDGSLRDQLSALVRLQGEDRAMEDGTDRSWEQQQKADQNWNITVLVCFLLLFNYRIPLV